MSITDKLPLSVSIIAFNEEENIGRTLESIADLAAEIVVVDAHSTDRTRQIAEAYGATVYPEAWQGFVVQKNSALHKCRQPWILALDCDEVVSADLKQSIAQKINASHMKGYCVNRRSFYLGKLLQYAWQPDWKLRLVPRSLNPRWTGYDPHDVLEIDGGAERLRGDLVHYSYKNLGDHMARMVKYAAIVADSYYKTGRRFHWYYLLLNPVSAFFKKFFLRRAYLDGIQGLLVAMSSFIYVFLKYAFLWEREHFGRSGAGAEADTER